MKRAALLFLAAFCLSSCDSPQHTVDRLRKEIADFKASPTDEKQAAIEKSFAKLNEQIAALENSGKSTEAAGYQQDASDLLGEYQVAKFARTLQDTKRSLEGLGDVFKKGVQEVKDAFSSPSPTNR